jgi:hypothetical protein
VNNIDVASYDGTDAHAMKILVDTSGKIILGASPSTVIGTVNINSGQSVGLNAGTNMVGYTDVFSSIGNASSITLSGGGIADRLTSTSTPAKRVRVIADTISSPVFIGNSSVSNTNYAWKLSASGEAVDIPLDNANKLYAVGAGGDTIVWLVIN